MMSKNHDDLWLWACLGIFGLFAARICHKQLSAVQAATEVSIDEGIDGSKNGGTKVALRAETLTPLALGPSKRLREAAAIVIEDMVLLHETFDLMLAHVMGQDRKCRDEALQCLRFITNKLLKYPHLHHQSAYAVLECLNSLHSEAYDFEIEFRQRSCGYRTPHYSNALWILIRFLQRSQYVIGMTQWLESYPFGGYNAVEDKKESINKLLSGDNNHEPMYVIVLLALAIPCIRTQLVNCNLVDGYAVAKAAGTLILHPADLALVLNDPEGARALENLSRSEETTETTEVRSRGSSFGRSPDDRVLRRRRRETVLVGEAGRPIEATDIFVPTHHEAEPPDLHLDPHQSQVLDTEDQALAVEGETVFRPLTPVPEWNESNSE